MNTKIRDSKILLYPEHFFLAFLTLYSFNHRSKHIGFVATSNITSHCIPLDELQLKHARRKWIIYNSWYSFHCKIYSLALFGRSRVVVVVEISIKQSTHSANNNIQNFYCAICLLLKEKRIGTTKKKYFHLPIYYFYYYIQCPNISKVYKNWKSVWIPLTRNSVHEIQWTRNEVIYSCTQN